MKHNFTNYFDLKQVERSGSSWSDKQEAKKELEKREKHA